MAKGTRAKGGGGTSNKENNNVKTIVSNSEHSHNTNNLAKGSSVTAKRAGKDKQKIIDGEENVKSSSFDSENQVNDLNSSNQQQKKDHPKQVQPTSTQIMLAQLIGGENMDDVQKNKIQQVMDITGKPEDAVATALFDAAWDENRAVELLLEDGDHLTAWEETGKKGKKKQKPSSDEGKEDMEDSDTFNGSDFREKGKGRGPPRMRRGGASSQGGDRSASRSKVGGDSMQFVANGSYDQSSRGRGDQPPRRGGRGVAGRSSYAGRGGRRGGGGSINVGVGRDAGSGAQGIQGSSEGGFSGSIDTWNPNGSSGDGSGGGGSSGAGGGTTNGGSSGSRSGQRRGGHNSKDAFDNAGNWGDDFPAADDWDNEEYTGSLADTKVFTASKDGKHPSPQKPQRGSSKAGAPYAQDGPQRSAPAAVTASSVSASVAEQPGSNSYSQSIDLSTLLHKPTTQSSIGSNSQSLLQFTQQATDSLKAAVGIGQQPQQPASTASKTGDLSYSSYASSAQAGSSGATYGQGSSAFTSIKPATASGVPPTTAGNKQQTGRSRMPPPSKIPNSAVEMPGDQLGRLDVQFGGLDLQFVGGGSAANNGDNVGSFEFNGTSAAAPSAVQQAPNATSSSTTESKTGTVTDYHPPSAKEVNKSLSNAMGTAGKLSANESGFKAAQTSSNNAPTYSRGDKSAGANDLQGYHHPGQAGYNYGHSKSQYAHAYGSNSNNQYGGHPHYGNSSVGGGSGYNQSYSASSSANNNYPKSASSYQSSSDVGGGNMTKGGFSGENTASNNATAVLGLTSTTNALSGKISATTASKVNVPNLPPGVANMLPQHYMAGLPAAAFYGLQQPAAAMYSAYGNAAAGLEDLAALQRASGLHTLQAGYYDPNSQYAATSLAAAVAGNRGDGTNNLSSLSSTASVSTTSVSSGAVGSVTSAGGSSSITAGTHNSNSVSANDKSAFGSTVNDSTSIPSSSHQQSMQQQQQNAAAAAAATPATLNFATNAFAAQQQALPPGYAYFYGQIPNVQAAYGAGGVYPATMAVPTAAGGGNNSNQFQKSYGTSYGSTAYDTLGQQGNKDFGSSYSGNSASGKSSGPGGSSGAGGAAHQYWGSNLW